MSRVVDWAVWISLTPQQGPWRWQAPFSILQERVGVQVARLTTKKEAATIGVTDHLSLVQAGLLLHGAVHEHAAHEAPGDVVERDTTVWIAHDLGRQQWLLQVDAVANDLHMGRPLWQSCGSSPW